MVEPGDEVLVVQIARHRRAERGVVDWAALAVLKRVQKIALRDVVGVDSQSAAIVPGAIRGRSEREHRIRIAAESIERLSQEVLVERDLQRGLAVAEQIVGERAAIGKVLPRDIVLRGERDVPRRREWRRTDGLLREARREVVEADRALDGHLVDRPSILSVEAEVVIEVRDRAEGHGPFGDAVGYALVEWIGDRIVGVMILVDI